MLAHATHGSGPNVVLVHGFLGSGAIFAPLTAHLAPRFTVTTVDLPAFGASADIPVPASVEALSDMVADTVRALGIQSCFMLGHSLGAMIALELSLSRPADIDGVLLYGGSTHGVWPDRFETMEASIARVRAQGIAAAAAAISANWFVRGAEDPMYPEAKAACARLNEEGAIAHMRMWADWTARDRLADVAVPTLVICGDQDRSTHPDVSVELWKKIPGAALFIAPNAGHALHYEQPALFNAVVADFLARAAAPSAFDGE